MRTLTRNDGQVTVLTAVVMVAIIGMTALVLDVGSWFRSQRVTQATVDAAALAGAQALPGDTAGATAYANDYATKNGGIDGMQITFQSNFSPDDTITVTQTRPSTGFFASLFGKSTVNVKATASAIAVIPTSVTGVAPIAVDIHHPELSGPGCPCFSVPTSIPLAKMGVPGGFGIINLDGTATGTSGASTVANWITAGYPGQLALDKYYSDTGAKWNNTSIQTAIQGRFGAELLFPVYDTVTGTGSNASYHVIGWAAFHITNDSASGSNGEIDGWFTRVIWSGIVDPSGPPTGEPDLGVHSVALYK